MQNWVMGAALVASVAVCRAMVSWQCQGKELSCQGLLHLLLGHLAGEHLGLRGSWGLRQKHQLINAYLRAMISLHYILCILSYVLHTLKNTKKTKFSSLWYMEA